MEKEKVKWYQKKRYLIPLSAILSLVGIGGIASLIGVSLDDELNEDYYRKRSEPLFKKTDK